MTEEWWEVVDYREGVGSLSTPPPQPVAPSHRILFAGPGECLVCSTCLTRITDKDVEEMGKNHDAEAYFCQRCIDFVDVRIRRLSTEEELEIDAVRLRKEWEEDKRKRDVAAYKTTREYHRPFQHHGESRQAYLTRFTEWQKITPSVDRRTVAPLLAQAVAPS